MTLYIPPNRITLKYIKQELTKTEGKFDKFTVTQGDSAMKIQGINLTKMCKTFTLKVIELH